MSETAVVRTAQDPSGSGEGGNEALRRRMEHAVSDFVDDPRRAVREADAVLEEAIAQAARTVAGLRARCAEDSAGTEELRVALTRYRDLAVRLLVG